MDPRDMAAMLPPSEGITFDERAMTLSIVVENDEGEEETLTVKAAFEVCSLCNGRGTHVNPSIDAHGITREEFDEDTGFKEEYMSGVYDVQCYECAGKRVVPVPDDDVASAFLSLNDKETLERFTRVLEDRAHDRRERAHEIEMGY